MAKTEQLQIRVTPEQKAALQGQAVAAGQDVSAYVLGRLLPPPQNRFNSLLVSLSGRDTSYTLAELNDLLTACPPMLFHELVADANSMPADQFLANYVAAMTEQAAALKGVEPPEWTQSVAPLAKPHFATKMRSLRMHLLVSAPVPFKRRNIFVDSSIGARV